MTLKDFKDTLAQSHPPKDLSPLLKSLWMDGKGDWQQAHDIAQEITSAEGFWVHAYLHRREGDHSNAAYWYRRTGRAIPSESLEQEWENLVTRLLG